jgi:hypothetical protein
MSQFSVFGHDAMEAERLKKGFRRRSSTLVSLATGEKFKENCELSRRMSRCDDERQNRRLIGRCQVVHFC